MGEGEKKADAGMISGDPQKKILYAIIAVAIVVLAVVLIAKFGYNTDLLNPAVGQMSLVQRQPVVTAGGQKNTYCPRGEFVVGFDSNGNLVCSYCGFGEVICSDGCTDLQNDPSNCGTCNHSCPARQHGEPGDCVSGQCV